MEIGRSIHIFNPCTRCLTIHFDQIDNIRKKMGMMYNGIEELKDKIIYKSK